MANTLAEGIRLDYVRKCYCGRRPQISTCYEGFEPGMGPFLISCGHGSTLTHKIPPGFIASRSWSKTRVVRNWNQLIRDESQK
jgi:hypothetical protein